MCHMLSGVNILKKRVPGLFGSATIAPADVNPADIASEKSERPERPERPALFYGQRSLFISPNARHICTHYYCILSLNESCRGLTPRVY